MDVYLDGGVDMTLKDEYGLLALDLLVQNMAEPHSLHRWNDYITVVKKCLKKGGYVQKVSTSVFFSFLNQYTAKSLGLSIDNIKELLELINKKHELENFFTQSAALHHVGCATLAQLLLDYGVHVNMRDALGDTPLHTAKNAEVAELLILHGANTETLNRRNRKSCESLQASEKKRKSSGR